MRRPAPLPRPTEQEPEPARRADARRTRSRARGSGGGARIESDDSAETTVAPPVREPVVATEQGPDGDAYTARDVWRAARARRKALRAEIRRFTQRSRRRRLIGLGVLGAFVLLVGGSAAAAYSPLFAVERITVIGAEAVDADAVRAALDDQRGTPLALVDAGEVKAALIAFPLIETYALEARPPHELAVRIVERTPIGVIRSKAGYTLVDAAGVALDTTPDRPDAQPVLEVDGGIDSRAFESVGLVVRSLPGDVRAQVTKVTAGSRDDVTLTLSSGLTVVWGSSERSVLKASTLQATMQARPDATVIDVTTPEVVAVG